MTVEELQIVISAKIDGVLDKVQKVKEKVADIQPKKAADVDVTTNKAQGNLKKLQAEIDRTQAKIQKLAEKQNAVQLQIDARAGMYSDVPNLTGMGREETFGTLMDRDPQVQKLNEQMSALDAQTAPLKTHLAETKAQIAGVGRAATSSASKMGLLGSGMRNAGSGSENLGQKTGKLQGLLDRIKGKLSGVSSSSSRTGSSFRSAGRNAGYFGRMVSRMLLSMMLYRGIAFVAQSVTQGFQNMALGSSQANSTMSALATNSLYLKDSFATALYPAVQALTPAFTMLSDAIADVLQKVGMFFAALNGQTSVLVAKRAQVDYAKTVSQSGNNALQVQQKQAAAAEKAAKRAAEAQEKAAAKQSAAEKRVQAAVDEHQKKVDALKKSIMGFDELNVLNAPADTWKPPTVPDYTSNVPSAASYNTATPPAWNGMPAPQDMFKSVKIPQKVSDTVNKIKQILKDLKQYLLGIGLIAVGVIICLFGNPGLGVALMIAGFIAVGYQMIKNKNNMTERVKQELAAVMRIIGTMLFAIGTIVMLSGNLGLGLALIIAGAASFAVAAKLDFNSTKATVKQKLADILAAVGALVAAIGIILVVTGVMLPLGIGLIVAGAAMLGTSVGLNFSLMSGKTKATLTQVLAIIGPIVAVIGIILCVTGVGIPLGIGLLIAGGAALGVAVGLNWDYIKNQVKNILSSILAIASTASVAIGLLLCLTGAGIPLGIGLIIAGMAGVHAADSISSNPITQWAKSLMNGVIGVFESGINWIISMLNKVHFTVPNWVVGIGGKKYGINIQPVHIPRLASGGVITGPTYSLIGEGRDHEAVLPLNDTVYSRIGKGIRDNGGDSGGMNTEKIIEHLDVLADAIQNMKLALYTDDRTIAESANRGNVQISKRYHRVVPG